MAFSDDYRALIEGTRDAARELLDRSRHDSWLGLRITHGTICQALERDDQDGNRDEQAAQKRRNDEASRAGMEGWKQIPRARREGLLLHVLGDERLIIREVTSRLNLDLGSSSGQPAVFESDARRLVMRLFRDRQLERVGDTFKGEIRYRYFQKRTLDGPIVGLEHAYQAGTGA